MAHDGDVETDRSSTFEALLLLPQSFPPPENVACWCAHQRPCTFLSAGGCTCLSALWRFRDWSSSSTSKGTAGNRSSDGGQRHERVGTQPFEGSGATVEQGRDTDISLSCCQCRAEGASLHQGSFLSGRRSSSSAPLDMFWDSEV